MRQNLAIGHQLKEYTTPEDVIGVDFPARSLSKLTIICILAGTLIFGIGFFIVLGSTSDTAYTPHKNDPLDSNMAYHSEAEESVFQLVALQSTATIIPTNGPAPFSTLDTLAATLQLDDEQRATLNAVVNAEINAAVQATFIALTPSPTPLPTRVPIAQTFEEHNPYLGPEDAPVVMVEFSDYQCPYCGRFHAEVLQLLLDHYGDHLRFVYREYPVIGGQSSALIGAAAQCANFQGKYWEYTDQVWENVTGPREAITDELILEYASNIELDMEAFEACLDDGTGFDNVVIDYEAGRAYNITGTPTFFINGTRLVGAQPVDIFMNVIDRELLQLGIQPPERAEVSSSSN